MDKARKKNSPSAKMKNMIIIFRNRFFQRSDMQDLDSVFAGIGYIFFGNPFPEWLQSIFASAGLRYRDINHTYTAFFNMREDAEYWERWVVGGSTYGQPVQGLKQYYAAYPIWKDVATRVLECDPNSEGFLEDF